MQIEKGTEDLWGRENAVKEHRISVRRKWNPVWLSVPPKDRRQTDVGKSESWEDYTADTLARWVLTKFKTGKTLIRDRVRIKNQNADPESRSWGGGGSASCDDHGSGSGGVCVSQMGMGEGDCVTLTHCVTMKSVIFQALCIWLFRRVSNGQI